MKYLIYGLIDPLTQQLRYIGQSSIGFERPQRHWKNQNLRERKDYCHSWIRSVLSKGFIPEIEVLEEILDTGDKIAIRHSLNEAEIFWIGYFKMIGANLTNMTNGGGGTLGLSSGKGRKMSDETKAKLSAKAKGRPSPAKGKPVHPNLSAAISKKNKNHIWTDEEKARASKQMKGRIPWNKGKKGAQKGVAHTNEFKQMMSKRMSMRVVSNETRQKMKDAWRKRKNDK